MFSPDVSPINERLEQLRDSEIADPNWIINYNGVAMTSGYKYQMDKTTAEETIKAGNAAQMPLQMQSGSHIVYKSSLPQASIMRSPEPRPTAARYLPVQSIPSI